jgi:HD-like signal output (HDOD) protein
MLSTPLLSRAEIVRHGHTLPPAPRIMAQLSDLLSDVDADVSDICVVLRADPALTARVMRMSKAIMFGGAGAEVMDVEQALARVGFRNVLGLVGAAGITQLAPEPLGLYGVDIDTFQRCSLCHAIAAENLARALGEDSQSAYLAALLRGIGMVVLDRAASEIIAGDSLFVPSAQEQSYVEFERRVFGLTSVDATRILMDEWRFPEAIVSAIDLHHLATPDALDNRLACIVNVAGEIAAAAGHGLPGDEVHWTASPGKYDVLGVTLEFWNQLYGEAQTRFAGACEALKAS